MSVIQLWEMHLCKNKVPLLNLITYIVKILKNILNKMFSFISIEFNNC